jgi:hypothetical protein
MEARTAKTLTKAFNFHGGLRRVMPSDFSGLTEDDLDYGGLAGILFEAERLVEEIKYDETFKDEKLMNEVGEDLSALEPTPLGPEGVTSVLPIGPLRNETIGPDLAFDLFFPSSEMVTISTTTTAMPTQFPFNPSYANTNNISTNSLNHNRKISDFMSKQNLVVQQDKHRPLPQRFPPMKKARTSSSSPSSSSWTPLTIKAVIPDGVTSLGSKRKAPQLVSSHDLKSLKSSSPSSSKRTVSIDLLDDDKERFREYQNDQWNERYEELINFKEKFGHCIVPHNYEENLQLAQWVKRQRYQYKNLIRNKRSTITEERKSKLDELGFIFDSHRAVWEEKFASLCEYKEKNGHAAVPSNFEDKNLAIWVKCQRRQYKLYTIGQKSAITAERISRLSAVGFVWNPRNL